jgi:hypothetical protein
VETAFTNLQGRLYPAVGLREKVTIQTNFGTKAFEWKPANMSPMDFSTDIPPEEDDENEK